MGRSLPKFDVFSLSYRIFGRCVTRILPHFKDLRSSLLKSRMKTSLESYVSFLILSSLISFAASFAAAAYFVTATYALPLWLTLLISFAIAIIASSLTFGALYAYPSVRASAFGRRIEDDLPYAVAHMSVLATAGAPPEAIIRSVAAVPRDAIAEFMSDVVRDMDLLGMSLIDALEAAKERSPSRSLTDFLSELTAIVRTGGDLRGYLISFSRSLLGAKAIEAREFGETLSTLAEVFVILMVVFPLLLLVMFSVMSLVGGTVAGVSIDFLMVLITYIIVPVLGLSFLIILDQIMPRGE